MNSYTRRRSRSPCPRAWEARTRLPWVVILPEREKGWGRSQGRGCACSPGSSGAGHNRGEGDPLAGGIDTSAGTSQRWPRLGRFGRRWTLQDLRQGETGHRCIARWNFRRRLVDSRASRRSTKRRQEPEVTAAARFQEGFGRSIVGGRGRWSSLEAARDGRGWQAAAGVAQEVGEGQRPVPNLGGRPSPRMQGAAG